MNFTQILSFLMTLAPFIEPALSQLESGTLQPELQKLIAGVTNPELNALLTGLDQAFDTWAKAQIAKV